MSDYEKENQVTIDDIGKELKSIFGKPYNALASLLGIVGMIYGLFGFFMNPEGEKLYNYLCLVGGVLVFAILILYRLIARSILRDRQRATIISGIDEVKDKLCGIDDRTHIRSYTSDATSNIIKLLDRNKDITTLRIICFGRNGYGDILKHIIENKIHIGLEIVMCNPDKNVAICRNDDKERIDEQLLKLLKNCHTVRAYVSDIPPTIRAASIYVRNNPIWASIQPYHIERNHKGTLVFTRPTNSIIITCDESSNEAERQNVVDYFTKEFERLVEHSVEVRLTADGNGVTY